MKRRDFLRTTGAAALAASIFPLRAARAAEARPNKILYYSRSVGFEHSAVKRPSPDVLSHSEKRLVEMGKRIGVEVVCTKDGTVFDGDLGSYGAFAFYSTGELTAPNSKDGFPAMTAAGKEKMLNAIKSGMGVIGFHAATDCCHTPGDRNTVSKNVDPFIAMLGGEFIKHGPQQVAKMRVTSPNFPGLKNAGRSFDLREEWYALKNFAEDLHVILVQETEGMQGDCYQRPPFPATWAHKYGDGRVFYSSLGHREDTIWDNELCQEIFTGAMLWALCRAEADITPNLLDVTPACHELSEKI